MSSLLREGGFVNNAGEIDEPFLNEKPAEFRTLLDSFRCGAETQNATLSDNAQDLHHATAVFMSKVTGPGSEQTSDTALFRQLLDEEVSTTTLATANEFIKEKGTNWVNIDDQGPLLKAEVASLESQLAGLENLEDAQEARLAALAEKPQMLSPAEQKELGGLQKLKRKLACPDERKVLAAAVEVMKDSAEAMQVNPAKSKQLSPETKQLRLDACEALKDLSSGLKDTINTLKEVRQASSGHDVLGLPEKLKNVRHKVKNALDVVKNKRNEAIGGAYPDKSGRVRAALQKVTIPGSKNDPITDVMSSLKTHEVNLEKGVYRERLYIQEATKGLTRASADLPEGKVRDAVSKLQAFCGDLSSRLKTIDAKLSHSPAPAGLKDLKTAAAAAIAMYRALEGQGVTSDGADKPKTQRDVFDGAMKKFMQARDDIQSEEIKRGCTEIGLAFSLLRNQSPHMASVGIKEDTLTQLKEVAMTLQSLVKKTAHSTKGLTDKIGLPSFERKKLTDMLESESDPLLTSLHWFELQAQTLAGTAKMADKVADMQAHKKGADPLGNVSDRRTESVNALVTAKDELKKAFSLVEHRFQQTDKRLAALEVTSREEFSRAQTQLSVMEKDILVLPEEIKRQEKKIHALRKFRVDNAQCREGFRKVFNQARKAANNAASLTFSQDRLTKTEIGLPCAEILQQVETSARTAAGTLREITHQDPVIYGPLQRVAIYLVLALHQELDKRTDLSPAEKDALVDKLADEFAAEIDTREFDREAFSELIKKAHQQKNDGTLQLPRDYRTVLAQPGLQWATLISDKGIAGMAKSTVSGVLRSLLGQAVDFGLPGGFLGSFLSRTRAALSVGTLVAAGIQREGHLKLTSMPGVPLPSGIIGQNRMETLKHAAMSAALTTSPEIARLAANGLGAMHDISKYGLSYAMEQARNHLAADMVVSSGITLAAAGIREGVQAGAIYASTSMTNQDEVTPSQALPAESADIAGPEITAATSTRSLNALKEFQQAQHNAAERVVEKYQLDKDALSSVPGQLNSSHDDVRMATQQEIDNCKKYQKALITQLAQAFIAKNNSPRPLSEVEDMMREEFKHASIELRNNQHWDVVQTQFSHNNQEYTSRLTPAGQMKVGEDDIFAESYQNKGVCSGSSKDTQHATNLWMSEITVADEEGKAKTLFKGVRHGILSPYGVEDEATRKTGSVAKAQEVTTAALYAKPDLLNKALAGEEVELQIVSTSLVTPGSVGNERKMLDDQMHAWQTLSKQNPVTLMVRGSDGELHQVKVRLKVAAFNFGVNEASLKAGLGQSASDKYNAAAFNQLLGQNLDPSAPPGGMVGEYLKTHPENREKVIELCQQLKEIYNKKSHHYDGGEPYKAAQRMAMLAYEIGAVPAYNCKSGKDRTGMLDAEIKREVVSQHQGRPLSKPGNPLSEYDKKLFQKVLVSGGNAEVQKYNTGVAGNKVLKELPLSALNLSHHNRIGNRDTFEQVGGLSELAKY
ncbi:inositol phosphate phosphatase SopB [Pantoea cypripedii]|nr:inositol phosphate phosphatase SopB [Pantoea cypripedii]MBP2197773.1 hypothetical protein [Pantoea cypripedii]